VPLAVETDAGGLRHLFKGTLNSGHFDRVVAISNGWLSFRPQGEIFSREEIKSSPAIEVTGRGSSRGSLKLVPLVSMPPLP
jgi:hypothetical protein